MRLNIDDLMTQIRTPPSRHRLQIMITHTLALDVEGTDVRRRRIAVPCQPLIAAVPVSSPTLFICGLLLCFFCCFFFLSRLGLAAPVDGSTAAEGLSGWRY